jgi:hypothetical protein
MKPVIVLSLIFQILLSYTYLFFLGIHINNINLSFSVTEDGNQN